MNDGSAAARCQKGPEPNEVKVKSGRKHAAPAPRGMTDLEAEHDPARVHAEGVQVPPPSPRTTNVHGEHHVPEISQAAVAEEQTDARLGKSHQPDADPETPGLRASSPDLLALLEHGPHLSFCICLYHDWLACSDGRWGKGIALRTLGF